MNQFFLDNIAIFMILILILLVVGIMMMSSIIQKQQLLMKKYKSLTKGRKAGSLEGIIQECIESVSKMEEEYKQLSLFDTDDIAGKRSEWEENKSVPCRIYDWRKGRSIIFMKLKEIYL